MRIRPYTASDRETCLDIFDSNTPKYFDASERGEYAGFLDNAPGAYFMLEDADHAVGCGGWAMNDDDKSANLTWGMVRGALHGKGYGAYLLQARLEQIGAANIAIVRINTSQHSAGFFAKFGFVETKRTPDGYVPGIDHVEMSRER